LFILFIILEKAKDGTDFVHDGMVSVRLYTNIAMGKYLARVGYVSL
jgi:hypothetical protein